MALWNFLKILLCIWHAPSMRSWCCELLENTTLVSIEAVATGCSTQHQQHQSFIKINRQLCGTNIGKSSSPSLTSNTNEDGLNIVSISPAGTIEVYSITSPLTQLRSRIRALRFFQRLQNGSVVVIVSQNPCVLQYPAWPKMIKNKAALDVGQDWNWNSFHHDTGLIVCCHGYCPSNVIGYDAGSGSLPYTRFSTAVGSNDVIRYQIKFGLKGYIPPQSKDTDMSPSSRTIDNEKGPDVLIILVSIGILVIGLLVIVVCYFCCRKKNDSRSRGNNFAICKIRLRCRPKKTKNDDDDVTYDEELYGMYAGLNTKRPSALPNNYEALQKMSVQYEKIDSPLVFKFNVTENLTKNNNKDQQILADVKKESGDEEEEDHYQPTSGPYRLRSATELSAKFDAVETLSQHCLQTGTELSVVSTSFGSSQNLFRKISDVTNPVSRTSIESAGTDSQFATYVRLESSESIYKLPSGVPKFEPPKFAPHTIHRDSYIAVEDSKYNVVVAIEEDDDKQSQGGGGGCVVGGERLYTPLSVDHLDTTDNECYEQLQF